MGKLLQPEPDAAVKPRVMERFPLVGDIHVEYPYSGNDVCECGKPLSRYNPHTRCYSCVERIRDEAWSAGDESLRALLDSRRRRSPRCPRIGKNLNTQLLERAATAGPRTRHRAQDGQS